MSKIPRLPDDSIHEPTSGNPSPSKGLLKATQPDNTSDGLTEIFSLFDKSRPDFLEAQEQRVREWAAQEVNKAQLDVIDRLARELEAEQSIEVNKDDTGLNYYYTIKSVEWAIERIRNQVTADKEQA